MASYPERLNLNFDTLHKDFDAILIKRNIEVLNGASDFKHAQILHNLAYYIE